MTKLDFEKVYMVYNSLFEAYHDEEEIKNEDGDLNEMFMSLWTIFLNSVSWTDEDFWKEVERMNADDNSSSEEEGDKEVQKINDLDTSTFTGYKKGGKETLN